MRGFDQVAERPRNWLICCCLLVGLSVGSSFAIVPTPAPDQSGPIALTGAVIHDGNGNVIGMVSSLLITASLLRLAVR